jgi:hypothetical protein
MGTKADFYSGLESKRDWIGSLYNNGDVWHIPLEILIQVNKSMFEELVLDFIRDQDGVIAEGRIRWPWLWSDSRCTDYSYIFSPEHEKVYMAQGCDILVDPIKILQGESLIEANVLLGTPTFPIMDKRSYPKTEELLKIYGYTPSQII